MPAAKKKRKRSDIARVPRADEEKQESTAARHAIAKDVERVADSLIPSPGLALAHLANHKILYLFSTAKQLGCNGMVAARLYPAWARPIKPFEFILVVSQIQWQNAPERVRLAAVAHGLSHFQISERGAASLSQHDYEDFATVAKRYGAWSEGGRIVQLKLVERGESPDAYSLIEQSEARASLAREAEAANGNGEKQAAD